MKTTETSIPGLLVIEPTVFEDSRGYFFESYNEQRFKDAGINDHFVQDNQSKSSYGVIRGLHYQLHPSPQAKLVRVLEGTILDVAVDIRKGSPTFGAHFALEISAENKKQLYIPFGFAHGFSVLSETATVLYKCKGFYDKTCERSIHFDDPRLGIDWKVPKDKAIVSEKDTEAPAFEAAEMNFSFND